MPLLCTRCGAHNAEGRQACVVCGSSLAGATLLPTQQPAQQVPAAAPSAPEQRGSGDGSASTGQAPPKAYSPVPARQAASAPPIAREPAAPPAGSPQAAAPPSPMPEQPKETPPTAAVDRGEAAVGEEAPSEGPDQAPPSEADAQGTGPAPAGGQAQEMPMPQHAPRWPEVPQPGAYPPWGYQAQMPYGYPMWQEGVGYIPQYGYGYPPMSPYGGFGGFPSYAFVPPMPWPGAYPPYGMPFYPPMQPPPAYPGMYGAQAAYQPMPSMPYSQPYAAPRPRMRTLYIVLIIIGVLLLIGGAVTAAILLTGNSNAAFQLGDGSVTGVDIDFTDLALTQKGSAVTLTGKYDNNTKREGKVYITVEAVSGGTSELLSFTVPVTPGKGKSFTQKKTEAKKLSQATLGALIYQGSSSNGSDTDSDTYPWDSTPSNGTSPDDGSNETTPFSTSPYSTSPYSTSPYTTPGSEDNPQSID